MKQMGIEKINHSKNEILSLGREAIAIRFCGLAIGRIIPPMLHANAMVSIVRGDEPNMEVTTTDAATLDTMDEMRIQRNEMER